MSKLLFILKRREMTMEEDKVLNNEKKPYFKYCMSSGLRNSAQFVVDMLNDNGVEAKLVEVVDNNCIDREVTQYKPTHVFIEAYWVVPEKFDILIKLHPNVQWIIRNHSELPFLANEGIAVDWTIQYLKYKNVFMAPNSKRTFEDTKKMVKASYNETVAKYKVLYLPNFYKIKKPLCEKESITNKDTLNIGCFGAVRPLKNHLVQAVAAIHFATEQNKKLNFHINVARIEDAGNNALKSIRGLFSNLDFNQFKLVEHGWLSHDDFLNLVATMDMGLQASFSESFNIVTADFVSQGIPVVVSEEIDWIPSDFHARSHTDSQCIADTMAKVFYGYRFWKKANYALKGLLQYNENSKKIWLEMFKN